MTTTMWLLGVIAGFAALVIIHFMFVIGIAVVVIVSLLRPRPAGAAGACIAWGVGYLIVLKRSADQCLEFNRQPNASCTMGDNMPFLMVGLAVLALGLLFTAYAAMRARGGAVPSSP